MLKIFSRIKLTYKSILITSLTGFDIAFTNVEDTLKQRQDKVVSTLFQRCFNVGHRRCINIVQRWKSDVGFCFIFNVESTSFQRWSTTLKQRWTDVEMLAGRYFLTVILSYWVETKWSIKPFSALLSRTFLTCKIKSFFILLVPVSDFFGGNLINWKLFY